MVIIVLIPHPGSHPFEERTVVLNSEIKVGRTTSNQKLSSDNLLFDTKVLSRIHASIWVENGKCLIKDNNSTNGTFLNDRKLSGADVNPHELCQGDLIQFGTNVPGPNGSQYLPVIADVIFTQVFTENLQQQQQQPQNYSPYSLNQGSKKFHTGIVKLLDSSGNLSDDFMREFKRIGRSINSKMTEMEDLNRYLNEILNEEMQDYFSSQKFIFRAKSLEIQLALIKNSFNNGDECNGEITAFQNETVENILNSVHLFVNDVKSTNLQIYMELENIMHFYKDVQSNLFETLIIQQHNSKIQTTEIVNCLYERKRQSVKMTKIPKIAIDDSVCNKLYMLFPKLYVDCFIQLLKESQIDDLKTGNASAYFNELISKLCDGCLQSETRQQSIQSNESPHKIKSSKEKKLRNYLMESDRLINKLFMPLSLFLGIIIGLYLQNYVKS